MRSQVSGSVVLYNNSPLQVTSVIRSFFSSALHSALTIVDNSGNEALRPIVEREGARYLRTESNLGFGAGHNTAIKQLIADSEYHLILNPDVVFGSDVLPELYGFMQKNRHVGLVMPRVLYPDGREQHLCKMLPSPVDLFLRRFGGVVRTLFRERLDRYLLQGLDLTRPRSVPTLSGCFMFVRSSVLGEIGGFDERYFMYMEDVDLCRRIGSLSDTVFFPKVSICHEYDKGSYRDSRLAKHHVASAIRYFNKWGWFRDKERDALNRRLDAIGGDPDISEPNDVAGVRRNP
jgi:GT2 family glycosyltransferase